MADNIGNLAVVMSLNAQQFNAGLRETATHIDQIQIDVTRMSATMNSAGNVVAASAQKQSVGLKFLSGAMQQGSFAAQDFASQLATRGLGGALQAASNNIQVMGSAFGPWGMAISAATGLAVQGLGTYLLMTQNSSKETKKAAREMVDAWTEAAKATNAQLATIRRGRSGSEAGQTFDELGGYKGATEQSLKDRNVDASRELSVMAASRKQVLKDFDVSMAKRFGKNAPWSALGETPTQFFGLDKEGARAVNVAGRLKWIGYKVEGKQVDELSKLDKELRDFDAQASEIRSGIESRTMAIPFVRGREKAIKDAKDAEDSVKSHGKLMEEMRSSIQKDVRANEDTYQRRMDNIRQAEMSGLITSDEAGIAIGKIKQEQIPAKQSIAGPQALQKDSDEVFARMQRAIRGETGASDKQESIKKNTADTAKATQDTAKAVKKLTDKPVVVVRF